jgi:hypothetical protein
MNKINLDLSILNNKRILIGTPTYENTINLQYMISISETLVFAAKNNINIDIKFGTNDSLIPRVRNNIVDYFINNDYDYLFFIDSDIAFKKEDFFYMIQLAVMENKDFIAAAYPIKNIVWDNIAIALENNLIETSNDFDKYSGRHSAWFLDYDKKINKTIPQKANVVSSGFMLLSKNIFREYRNAFPERKYTDYDNIEKFSYFWCGIDEESKQYLSEDYMFCLETRRIGFDIWLCPWVNLTHTGTYTFQGSYSSFLQLTEIENKE